MRNWDERLDGGVEVAASAVAPPADREMEPADYWRTARAEFERRFGVADDRAPVEFYLLDPPARG